MYTNIQHKRQKTVPSNRRKSSLIPTRAWVFIFTTDFFLGIFLLLNRLVPFYMILFTYYRIRSDAHFVPYRLEILSGNLPACQHRFYLIEHISTYTVHITTITIVGLLSSQLFSSPNSLCGLITFRLNSSNIASPIRLR